MNANAKLHQLHLEQWTARFRDQAASGLSVKDWCTQNNFTIHNYYYWKRVLKEEYVDSVLPDIVPILQPAVNDTQQFPVTPPSASAPVSNDQSLFTKDLHNLYNSLNYNSIHISCRDFSIDLGTDVSSDVLSKVLKAVRHA